MTENQKINTPQAIILAGIIIAVAIFIKLPTPENSVLSQKSVNKVNTPTAEYKYIWQVKPQKITPDNRLGNNNAEIEIVEYSDIECPFCKNFHKTMHQVIDNYKGEVAWVYKHLPLEGLHKYAYNEAIATECVAELGDNVLFWTYLDALFESTTSNDGLPPSMLPVIAESIGINKADFERCMLDPSISAKVDADIAEVKTLTDRLGTPFAVIKKNGEIVDTITGALPYAQMIERVEKFR